MSIRWISVLAWVASMAVVWAVFTPAVLSWPAFLWLSVVGFLVLSGVLTVAMRSPRSVGDVIADTEAEAPRGFGRLARIAIPEAKPFDRMKGDAPR